MMHSIRRFCAEARLSHKGRSAAFSAEEYLWFEIAYPLVTMIFYCLLASFSFRTSDLAHWVIGNSFLLCTNACVFSTGQVFAAERYNGRLRSIIASPCSKFGVILSNGVYPVLFASCAAVLGLIVGGFMFHVNFAGANPVLLAAACFAAMCSATGFGLLLASFCLMTDSMHLILNCAAYVLMLFTGAEFPIAQLPTAGRIMAQMMPLTKSIRATQELLDGNSAPFLPLIALEFLTALCYCLAAFLTLRLTERAAQKNGRFDLF